MSALSLEVRPVEAEQRFAFSAENIDPTPWQWRVWAAAPYGRRLFVSGGQASFRVTALVEGRVALAIERHRRRQFDRSLRRMRRAAGGRR